MKDELTDKTALQSELLYNRLVKRAKHLRKWARRTGAAAFRLYDRDIPEIPLVLDLYTFGASAALPVSKNTLTGECACVGALYKRPYDKDEAEEALWLKAMKDAISKALEIGEDNIFLKTRQKQKGKAQYSRLAERRVWKDIQEGNLKFRVNLSDYLDTGLFLDARKKRSLLLTEAKGKRVLNLFSYTCSLSVAAAAGGAVAVDSVDMSNTYLEWGAINFGLNGYRTSLIDGKDYFQMRNEKLEMRSEEFRIKNEKLGISNVKSQNPSFLIPHSSFFILIRADVLIFLENANGAGVKYDLIILDPPSFSNSKKMNIDLDIRRDYKDLIQKCLALLSPGGKIWFSTNKKGFRLESSDFPGITIKDIGSELVDEDFKGKRTQSCYVITHS